MGPARSSTRRAPRSSCRGDPLQDHPRRARRGRRAARHKARGFRPRLARPARLGAADETTCAGCCAASSPPAARPTPSSACDRRGEVRDMVADLLHGAAAVGQRLAAFDAVMADLPGPAAADLPSELLHFTLPTSAGCGPRFDVGPRARAPGRCRCRRRGLRARRPASGRELPAGRRGDGVRQRDRRGGRASADLGGGAARPRRLPRLRLRRLHVHGPPAADDARSSTASCPPCPTWCAACSASIDLEV